MPSQVAILLQKKELLRILNSFDPLITGFDREALDYDMLKQAEQLLINVVTKKYRSCSTRRTEIKTVPPPVKQQKIC